jgi:hypothetical protein
VPQHLRNRLAVLVEIPRGVPDYKYPQNTSPALRINEGHKLAEFYSATTASCGVSVAQFCAAFYRRRLQLIDGILINADYPLGPLITNSAYLA